jgi:hypothetical protein
MAAQAGFEFTNPYNPDLGYGAEYSGVTWPQGATGSAPNQDGGWGGSYEYKKWMQAITALYQKYYGRVPTDAEMGAHLTNLQAGNGSLSDIEAALKNTAPSTSGSSSSSSGTGWDSAPTDGNWESWFLANVKDLTPSIDTLLGLKDKLAKYGITLVPNRTLDATGNPTNYDIRLPDGTIVDVIAKASEGGTGWHWLAGGGRGGNDTPIKVDDSYLLPWTKEFSFGDFQAPTAEDLYADPSFEFRTDYGRGVLENAAAAKGLLNSGGTLTDLLDYGQAAASQEYSNAFDRKYSLWNTNRNNAWQQYVEDKDTWYANQNNPWSKLYQAASLGSSAASA